MQRIVHSTLITIDPTSMGSEQKSLLAKVLLNNSHIAFFAAKAPYTVPQTTIKESIKYNFTHNILWHECNPRGKHAGESRYEVMNQSLLGKGTYGQITKSLATIHAQANGVTLYKIPPENKQRVIKKFIPYANEMLHDMIELAEYQYILMMRMDHMHVKPPVNTGEYIYLVMRKLPGETLHSFLKKERDGRIKLTTSQRFKLSLAIANALQKQIHDKNIMHRDLSSANIMVEMADKEFNVNIIDFDLASDIHAVREISVFSIIHTSIAPELRGGYVPSSIGSDIYSLARAISGIFRFDSANFASKYKTYEEQLQDERQNNINLDGIFDNLDEIGYSTRVRVLNLLTAMGKYYPNERCSLADAIVILTRLYNEVCKLEEDATPALQM